MGQVGCVQAEVVPVDQCWNNQWSDGDWGQGAGWVRLKVQYRGASRSCTGSGSVRADGY